MLAVVKIALRVRCSALAVAQVTVAVTAMEFVIVNPLTLAWHAKKVRIFVVGVVPAMPKLKMLIISIHFLPNISSF
jgi:hypothetical protein